MFLKIIDITLPIFAVALIGFVYSRRVKPDLASANKLVVDIALPMLIFTSLATKNFDPQAAIAFTGASVMLMLVSGVLAWPVARFSGASVRAFLPCVMFTNVGPVGIPLIVLAYGPEGLAPAVVLLVISNLLHFTVGAGERAGGLAHGVGQPLGLGHGARCELFAAPLRTSHCPQHAAAHDWQCVGPHDAAVIGGTLVKQSSQRCQSGSSSLRPHTGFALIGDAVGASDRAAARGRARRFGAICVFAICCV